MRPRKGRCRIEVTKANIAYKFELMPTREQKRIFAQAVGWRRFVWNKAIELQKRCLEQEVPFLKYRKLFKNPRAKPDGTKMFCSAFLNDARMCCFFANAIVKY